MSQRRRRNGRAASGGGLAARRAVVRWSWRLFRREWRQQVLVLVLITVAVAVTVAAASAAYNMAPSGDAGFGTASHRLTVEASDRDELAVEVDAIEDWFATTEQIRTEFATVPGSAQDVLVRAQDPSGPFGSPLIDLRAGLYPSADDEVAVTDELAETYGVVVGDTLELGDRTWSVVGIVENPEDLRDQFALVAPTAPLTPDSVEILVDASDDQVRARPGSGSGAETFVDVRNQGSNEKGTAAIVAYVVATVVLLLVALVAAAGFAVMAQRRQRQIGLLAATGATDRHVRLVMVANGAAVGLAAAVAGTATGLLTWFAIGPTVESAAGHRIERFDVPWWLVVVGMLLAVGTATAASWWPARAAARVPVTAALSERPPAPRPAHRSALLAAALLALGVGLIWWADPNRVTQRAQPSKDIALMVGVVAISFGVLLLGPIVLRTVGRSARRLPVIGRLAVRDLARFQARSGMALGAVSLAVGIPIAVVITSSVGRAGADEGDLSERDLLLRIGDAEGDMVEASPPDDLDRMAAEVDELARRLGDAAVVPLEMPVEAASEPIPGFDVRPAVAVGVPVDENVLQDVPLYVATPGLLDQLGVDPDSLDPTAEVLTVRTEPLSYITEANRGEPETVTRRAPLDVPAYTSGPTTLVTPEAVERRGWGTEPVGWLVTSPSPVTGDQVQEAREIAAEAGMVVVARSDDSTASLRVGAIAAGSLLALTVVAMTVGLVRSEVVDDLRTLTATGATRAMRRGLTAWTAGTLALMGVVLGGLGAYVALASGYARELGQLGDVPFVELVVLAAGIPLLAAGAGWVLGGREPSSLVRPDT